MINKEFKKCDNCRCLETEHLQHEFWLGVDTSKEICSNSHEEYDMVEMAFKPYMYSMPDETVVKDCVDCKTKTRALDSKKYFYEINSIIKSIELDKETKLIEIYKVEEEYFKAVGGF